MRMRQIIPKQLGYCSIIVIQGGNNAALLQYHSICSADLVLVLDARNELQRILPVTVPLHVKAFALGQGHTAKTLAVGASSSIQRCINNTAGMDAEAGLGQWRGMGCLATNILLDSLEMKEFLNETLLDFLMQAAGGVLEHVTIIGKGSVAGGTASSGLLQTIAAIEMAVTERSNAIVEVELELTGSISYAGCGPRVHKNAASGIVDALAFDTSPDQHAMTIRSMRLKNLPPVGNDREARNRFMLEVEQALQCAKVRDILYQKAPNNSLSGPLGNVTVCQSGHFTPLHPRFQICRDIAPDYCRRLQQILLENKPQPSLVQRLVLNTHRQDVPCEDLQSITERIETSDPNEIIAVVALPMASLSVSVDVALTSGDTLRLSDAHAIWASAPSTLAEIRKRLILQSTCIQLLEQEIGRLESQLADVEYDRLVLSKRLLRMIARRQNDSFLSRLKRSTFGSNHEQDLFVPLARQFRTVSDNVRQYEVELNAIKHVLRLLEAERKNLVSNISSIIVRLDALSPRGQREHTEPTVVAKPLDAILTDLWESNREMDNDTLAKILLRAVDHVTLHGLAFITESESGQLEVIAARIAHRQFAAIGPPWGGKAKLLDGLEIVVLPPVTQETATMLDRLIRKCNPACTVIVAERMPASLNCVTLYINPVTDLKNDIFTQYLRRNLLDAYQDKNRDMYFPSGTAGLDQLGISIDGEVKFHDDKTAQERC